jgi:HEAT repeat protein
MLVFCTACWLKTRMDAAACSCCGAQLEKDPRAYEEKLEAALHHHLPPARSRICWVLGDHGGPGAISLLLRMLDDEDVYVRIAALKALGRIGDITVLPVLENAATHPSLIIRLAANQALQSVRRNTGTNQYENR